MALGNEDEVTGESFTFDELQSAFDELHAEFMKLSLKSNCQKKVISSLSKENESLTSKINDLENETTKKEKENDILTPKVSSISEKTLVVLQEENESLKKEQIVLKENIENLKNTLSKFTQCRETLDKILKNQNRTFGRAGIGYKSFSKVKTVKNGFVHASSNHSHLTCHFCDTKDHISPSCPIKRNTYIGTKKVWIPKFLVTNLHGPKQVWVPKTNL